MTDTAEQLREEDVAAEPTTPSPVDTPAPETLDDVLASFDQETAPPPQPDNIGPQNGQTQDELDQLIAELSGPTADQQRIGELEGQLRSIQHKK